MPQRSSILYVDDEPTNLLLFERYFEDAYQIHTARSGAEALEILSREPIELVLTDQRMPGMTGVELLSRVAEKMPDTARMIVTAHSDVRVVIDAINTGRVDQYISKPWEPDELQVVLDRGLESNALRRRHRELVAELEASYPERIIAAEASLEEAVVLYVDDELQNLEVFERAFGQYFTLLTARSGKEALEILRRREVHLVVADQRMPEMTGVELFEIVVREMPETVRIVLTAYLDIEAAVQAINSGGVYRYILKPWSPKEMRVVLERALEIYELRRRNRRLLAALDGEQ